LLNNVAWKIGQELDMQFVASSNSFLTTETIKLLNDCGQPPNHQFTFFGYTFDIFESFKEDKFYLIGVDTASEGGGDSSTIVVVDFETLEQIAEYKAPHIRVEDFCEVVAKASTLYPNNMLVVESNSYGNQVCEYLTHSGTFYNLYKTEVKSKNINAKGKSTYKYGLFTGSQNRPLIIDSIYTFVEENPHNIKSEALALELIGMVDNAGKIEADEGENDDLVLAYGFCCYVRLYDPPMGMFDKFTSGGAINDMSEIANWNTGNNDIANTRLIDYGTLSTSDDSIEMHERANKQINQYVKSNLSKLLEAGGPTIDILNLINGEKD
jgi:hypothetical protein